MSASLQEKPWWSRIMSLSWTATNKGNASCLREKIKQVSWAALQKLNEARVSDAQILHLTRADLNELLPGLCNFQCRLSIMELINEAKDPPRPTADELMGALEELIDRRAGWEEFVSGGLCHEYLQALRSTETQLTAALDLLRTHIRMLEVLSKLPMAAVTHSASSSGKQDRAPHPSSLPTSTGSSSKAVPLCAPSSPDLQGEPTGARGHAMSLCGQPESGMDWPRPMAPAGQRQCQGPASIKSLPPPVQVHVVVRGNTFGEDRQILQSLRVTEVSMEECRVVLLFCPVISRIGTDVDAALQQVQVEREVILIVMHHTFKEQYHTVSPRTSPTTAEWVNVLFHESKPGLLSCSTNDQAIAMLKAALNRYL